MNANMSINDNKAGMETVDKEKVNKMIADATRGSKFDSHQQKKMKQLKARVEKQLKRLQSLSKQDLRDAQIKADKLANSMERGRDLTRSIVHVDMDAFYAAVEMRDNPALRDVPMAVGETLC